MEGIDQDGSMLLMGSPPRRPRNLMSEFTDEDNQLESDTRRRSSSGSNFGSSGRRKKSSRKKRSSKKDKPIQKLIKRVNGLEKEITKLERENNKMKLWKRQMIKLSDDLENRYYNKSQIDDTIDNMNLDINEILMATKEMGYKWSGPRFFEDDIYNRYLGIQEDS
tara:strand:+ start:225 stop:719 length:495 start_codon:yes stop_codon:yes gene_type:complete